MSLLLLSRRPLIRAPGGEANITPWRPPWATRGANVTLQLPTLEYAGSSHLAVKLPQQLPRRHPLLNPTLPRAIKLTFFPRLLSAILPLVAVLPNLLHAAATPVLRGSRPMTSLLSASVWPIRWPIRWQMPDPRGRSTRRERASAHKICLLAVRLLLTTR